MKAHVDFGLFSKALVFYRHMRESGVEHDSFTFPIVNRAVLLLRSDHLLVLGETVHCVAMKIGFGCDVYFCNTMIEVYVRTGFVSNAWKVFDEMMVRDLVSWTSMISGYVFERKVGRAFELFSRMRLEAVVPNSVTVIVMLEGCCACEILVGGRQLHAYVMKNGILVDGSVQNSVLKMYCKMGCVQDAEALFMVIDQRDVISWNTLINCYSLTGCVEKVTGRFNQMQSEVGLCSEILTSVISAFAKIGNVMEGEKLHCLCIKAGLHDHVLLTAFLDFYSKCGKMRSSTQLFGEISCRSSITWNAMMSGLIRNGCFDEAINFFLQMQATGFKLEAEILGNLVDACAYMGALQLGKGIHGYLTRNHFVIPEEVNTHLRTSILNMYIRCGSLPSARKCFNAMPVKDIVTWTSMIDGCGINGLGMEALNLFHQMLKEGMAPNRITFLSLLSGSSHSGLVHEGCEVFFYMKWMFGIEPDLDHYTCIVDLLGRSGKLKEALAIIIKMVVFPDSRIWGAFLAASRVHGDRRAGEFAARRLLELEPDNVGYYTLLSNVQASIGEWTEVEEVRRVMHEKDLKKTPGWSCIEEKGRNFCFVSGDRLHKRAEEIYEVLGYLSRQIQELGHV